MLQVACTKRMLWVNVVTQLTVKYTNSNIEIDSRTLTLQSMLAILMCVRLMVVQVGTL